MADSPGAGTAVPALAALVEAVLAQSTAQLAALDQLVAHWPADQSPAQAREKFVGECAILLLVAARAPPLRPRLDTPVAALAHALSQAARGNHSRALLMRRSRSAPGLALPHIVLTAIGHPDPAFQALLAEARHLSWRGPERSPFRIAEHRWQTALATGEAPDFADLLPLSLLANPLDLTEADHLDLYTLTHWVMYLGDFGQRPLPALAQARCRKLLDAAIAWQLHEQDFDLVAELLLVARLVEGAWTARAEAALAHLLGQWAEAAFLPSPGFSPARSQSLKGPAQQAYVTAYSYHTHMVLAMLAAMVASHPPSRPQEGPLRSAEEREDAHTPPPSTLATQAAHQALAFAGLTAPLPQPPALGDPPNELRAILARTEDQRPLLPALQARLHQPEAFACAADGALIAAIHRYDLPALAALLELVARTVPQHSAAFRPALAWLVRQQLPSGAIGAQALTEPRPDRSRAAAAILGSVLHACAPAADTPMSLAIAT